LYSNDSQILGTQSPDVFSVSYYESQADAANGTNALASPYTNITNPQTIFAAVNSNSGSCTSNITTFNLVVNELNINTSSYDLFSCGFGSGVGYFDLTVNESQITNGDTSLVVSYYVSLNDAFNNVNALTDPSYYENIDSPFYQTIYIRVDNPNNACFYVNSNTVLYLNVLDVQFVQPTPLVADDPDNDGFTPFDLTLKDNEITAGNSSYTVTYYETYDDANNAINALVSPYINITPNSQIVYFRVEDNFQGCYSTGELVLLTEYAPFQVNPAVLELCQNSTGAVFNLTSANQDILSGLMANDYTIAYYESENDALSQTNPITNETTYNYDPNIPIVYAGVTETTTGDYVVTSITLIVNDIPVVNFNGNLTICSGDTIILKMEYRRKYTNNYN